jgi:hypothetical protein
LWSQYNQAPQYNTLCGDNQGNIGDFRGGCHGGRGFGGCREPVVFHNCQKPRHYAIDYPQLPTTCMYFHATDHETQDCLTLMVNIQYKRYQNNQNVQWIYMEKKEEDGKNINIVTRGGEKKGIDAKNKDQYQCQWFMKNTKPEHKFDG